jgi:hypothetical protein
VKFLGFRRKPAPPDVPNVRNFFAALGAIATPAGRGDFAFRNPDGSRQGYAQFIIHSPTQITIHRLWTRTPGKGAGSAILRSICNLADQQGVELTLQTIPLGRKPYPLNRDQLAAWYSRHGFVQVGKKMKRKPGSVT